MADQPEFAAIVTIYRLSQDYGLTIGDSLLIPDPQMHIVRISLKNEVLIAQFNFIRFEFD